MIYPSKAFRDALNAPMRNRGYMQLILGIVNKVFQANGVPYIPYKSSLSGPDSSLLRHTNPNFIYVTWEYNLWSTSSDKDQRIFDGNIIQQDQCITQDEVSGDTGYWASRVPYIDIRVPNQELQDVVALTIDWDIYTGEYPASISIQTYDSEGVKVTDNQFYPTKAVGEIYEINARGITRVRLIIWQSKSPYRRFRVTNVTLGAGITFTGEDIISSTLTRSASALSVSLPQVSFEATLNNIDGRFDPDDADSLLSFFKMYQTIEVQYGLDVSGAGDVEWIDGGQYYIKNTPAISNKQLVVQGFSLLEMLDDTYVYSKFTPYPVNAYEMMQGLFNAAISEVPDWVDPRYFIDSRLTETTVNNLLPKDTTKNNMQLTANAARATITTDRSGVIQARATEVVDSQISIINAEFFSSMYSFDKGYTEYLPMVETFEKDVYRTAPNSGYIYTSIQLENTQGLVGQVLSDEDGVFPDSGRAAIRIDYESETYPNAVSLYFDFRNGGYATELSVTWYKGETVVGTATYYPTVLAFAVPGQSFLADAIHIEPTKWSMPFQRCRVSGVIANIDTGVTIYQRDIKDGFTSEHNVEIKKLNVQTYSFTYGDMNQEFLNESVSANIGYNTYTFERSSLYTDASYTLSRPELVIDVEEHYDYYTKIVAYSPISVTPVQVVGVGDEINIVESRVLTKESGYEGITDTASNVLVPPYSANFSAERYLEWMYNGVVLSKIWSVPFRGDPTIDPLDIVHLELRDGRIVICIVEEVVLKMNGAFDGSLRLREVRL